MQLGWYSCVSTVTFRFQLTPVLCKFGIFPEDYRVNTVHHLGYYKFSFGSGNSQLQKYKLLPIAKSGSYHCFNRWSNNCHLFSFLYFLETTFQHRAVFTRSSQTSNRVHYQHIFQTFQDVQVCIHSASQTWSGNHIWRNPSTEPTTWRFVVETLISSHTILGCAQKKA